MKIYYSDHFDLPLPEGHRFPIAKYRLLRGLVAADPAIPPGALAVPEAVGDAELERAHDAGYVRRAVAGGLTAAEERRLGFPWSPALVERARRSVGGTLAACRAALADGCGVNLAGGTHHAFADRGEGFCLFNDVAVAARRLLAEGKVARVVVIDCDVHQGNGTARIFAGDERVFTFSLHGRDNYPARKETSDLDIELPDGAGDDEYLAALDRGLAALPPAARLDLAVYLAGVDPHADDRLGRMAVTSAGLAERDRRVLAFCRGAGLPVAVVMAGGYSRDPAAIAALHHQTVRLASEIFAAAPV